MTDEKKPPQFHIINHKGEPQQAQTAQNVKIKRQEKLFVPEWGAFVMCTPYDDHFIYENPDKSKGSPAYMCTCGAVAVVAPPGPTGFFVCMFHAQNGYHATAEVNKKDWQKVIGETIITNKKGKTWQ